MGKGQGDDADGDAQHRDGGLKLVLEEVAQGNLEVVENHVCITIVWFDMQFIFIFATKIGVNSDTTIRFWGRGGRLYDNHTPFCVEIIHSLLHECTK